MDYDSYAEELQDHSSAPLLCPEIYNTQDYEFCHWAKTVTGFDVNSGRNVVVAVTCKRWGCPWCALKKIRRLAWMCRNAEPSRLLTLTISSKRFDKPEDGWNAMSKAFPELVRWIRKQVGECEYMRVLELTNLGTPHFHCMLRCNYVQINEVLREWRRLIGEHPDPASVTDAPREWAGVNLKRIDQSFATFRYLVKYLTKLHKIPWTDRHVSYSKGFFRPEDKEEVEYAKLDNIEQHDVHPWVFLRERFAWEEVRVLDHCRWELPGDIPDKMSNVNPADLGLPSSAPDQPLPPLKQRLVPGLEADGPADQDEHLRPDGRKRGRQRRVNPAKQTVDWPPPPTQQPLPDDF